MEQSFLSSIAGVDVQWVSDCPPELDRLRELFVHHIVELHETANPLHTVRYEPIFEMPQLPQDVEEKWNGYYFGCFQIQNTITWLHSPSTGLDFLLPNKEIQIVHDRNKCQTICYLHCHRSGNGFTERPDISDTIVILVHTIMSMYGRYSIHAAAVRVNGKAHVFVGESGHGKSTICTDLAALGADYLGDDLVFLYLSDGVPYIGSLLFQAKLFPEHTKDCKDFVDIIKRNQGAVVLQTPVKCIYYLTRTIRRKSYFEKQPPIEMIVRLMRASNNVRMQFDQDLWQDTLQQTAMLIPYYTLHYGRRDTINLKILEDVK